jgi:hypothetical protein
MGANCVSECNALLVLGLYYPQTPPVYLILTCTPSDE